MTHEDTHNDHDRNTVALRLDGVTKVFPGVRALDDVELEVVHGEVHGIVGENGAGKSTLMAVASGALVPDAGSVLVDGHPLEPGSTREAHDLGIAIVRQEPALVPDLSVAENMYLSMPHRLRPQVATLTEWCRDLLEAWNVQHGIDPDARAETLRPDDRFVVDIVRAVAQRPAVLVLDEPTEHLGAPEVERLFAAIRRQVDDGGAVVYISHRVVEVKQIADRVSVLRDGRLVGTHDATALEEGQIVDLIVGRRLGAVFPAKRVASEVGHGSVLGVEKLGLEVLPGEIVGFAGIEGNGQREALRAIAGLEQGDSPIAVDGRPAERRDRRIVFLTGDRHREGTFPGLSVRDTVALRNLPQLSRAGFVSEAREREFAERAVGDFDVRTPDVDTLVESLSGGNQQKVLIAGALRRRPRVLAVHEPTQGVDVGAKVGIYELLRAEATEQDMAVVVASSDVRELVGLCDRVLVFSRGQVTTELKGDDLTEVAVTAAMLTATTERPARSGGSSRLLGWLAGDSAPLVTVGVAIVALGMLAARSSDFYLSSINLSLTLALAAVLGFAALGQTVALVAGVVDLSVGPLMGFLIVVQSFFLVYGASGGSQLVGWLLLLAVPSAVGWVNWALVDLVRLNAIVATLVTFIALQALSLLLRPQPGGVFMPALLEGLGAQIGPVPIAFIVMVATAGALQLLLRRSRLGICLRAVGSDAGAAQVNGVRVRRVRMAAFVGCSWLGAVAGLLMMAQVGTGNPTSGEEYTLISIAAAVIGGASLSGGRGSFVAAAAAAVLVTQVVAAVPFLDLGPAWASLLPGVMTLAAVALYAKSRHVVAHAE
ncbi:ATP-binding cassette domain-containing protein [Nocardioides humi]|uniref:ABC transporter domain-containing protein n=1 Tax=Nocardioides humi TaxID=449461 RepID=A0ABN2BX43_9ACTN|nr:ATP-binding cassette domain-containing protein [Nocardioides humi]